MKIIKKAINTTALACVLLFSIAGCGGLFRSPEGCFEAISDAVSNDDSDAFFDCVINPPSDASERDALFESVKSRLANYLGGRVMSTNEVGDRVIITVSPSSESLSNFGASFAPPPLSLAFSKDWGWKFDIEYTEELENIGNIYKGIFEGF